MPDGRGRWDRRHWGPPDGRRPRWWPENEPWPPADDAPWRRMRRRFMWRLGCGFLLFILLLGSLVALVAWLVGGLIDSGALVLLISAVLPLVGFLLFVVLVIRLVRGTGTPVADLIEGAGRLEAGEIGTQVPERGPSEVRSLARAFNSMSTRLADDERARRTLLADVSHELRTPLTVMQGTLEGVLDGVYPADEAHLRPVLDETRVLSRLIDDLRTLSLSEAGALRLYREPTDLRTLLGEVVASHRAVADEAGVRLDLEVGEMAPMSIDPARVRQVLANLVANALRFTPSGGRVMLEASAADGAVAIRVSDTGRGMEPDEVEHAFDRFYRSPGSTGSGLGLSIARNLVEAHGGRIELNSIPSRGTTVDVWLPRTSV
jgi:two-component system, OmpR family, sensor histidine kinase BaeS